ncbi:MAG: hypothetical protein EBT60_02560 [Bacteroidetes bacterium]|nr:hypothetical protein [Bacteroidota bacterium]
MKKLLWLSVIVFTLFAQQSCSSDASKKPEKKDSVVSETIKTKGSIDGQLSAFARYIAGVHDANNDSLESSEFWKLHAAKTDLRWRLLMQNVGTPIGTWVSEKNYLPKTAPKTLLYPFAGGDFFYANLFYPNRDTVIMIGLEPVGSVFDVNAIDRTKLEDYLTTLDRCMFYPHKLGFFRTLSMDDDFAHELMNGTLHTFMFYLARNGFDLHYIEYFNLDAQGKAVAVEPGAEAKGLKIGYSNKADKQVRQLVYISQDISNTANQKSPGTINYLKQRGKVVSFFKAASYLMYKDYFSDITNVVLDQSKIILQDDSGMPLSAMKAGGFDAEVLGEYTKTIGLFSNYFQKDMRAEYEAKKPAKLPFTIGYNAEFGECNLQLGTKK